MKILVRTLEAALVILAVALLALLSPACCPTCTLPPDYQPPPPNPLYDLLIVNGTVLDGGGGEPFQADVAILGDRIAAVGDLGGARAREVIDATGLYVTPGFIDVHSHADRELTELPDAPNLVRQGITTVVAGNCGGSAYPVGEFFQSVEVQGTALNVALLIGHNTIRRQVMGMAARPPTAEELEQMRGLVRRGMEEGAVGLSTGLKYPPGAWADTDEVAALAEAAAEFGGLYASHMREEGREVVDAVAETIEIGRRAGLGVQISHHKVTSVDLWGASSATLGLVDAALEEGIAVYIDQYPYPATSTALTVLLPPWSLEGGRERLAERLENPELRARIREAIVENILHDRGGSDPANIRIADCESRPDAEGRSFAELLEERGREPTPEEAAELTMEIQAEGGAQAIYFCLADEDIERIMRHPRTMIASDSHICSLGEGVPHPRNYGTFPRVFRLYVRELGVLTYAEAVRKMTSLPAEAFRLHGRGLIARGMFADICVFDPEIVADTATWDNPHCYPVGIRAVIVNGRLAVWEGRQLGERAGRVLRHVPRVNR